jgi:hypothetical protein
VSMAPSIVVLFAASVLYSIKAQSAAERIRQAQHCTAVERRPQHREIERVQTAARVDVKPDRDLSGEERDQLRQACGNLVYDRAAGFYALEQKEGCR